MIGLLCADPAGPQYFKSREADDWLDLALGFGRPIPYDSSLQISYNSSEPSKEMGILEPLNHSAVATDLLLRRRRLCYGMLCSTVLSFLGASVWMRPRMVTLIVHLAPVKIEALLDLSISWLSRNMKNLELAHARKRDTVCVAEHTCSQKQEHRPSKIFKASEPEPGRSRSSYSFCTPRLRQD